MPNSLAPDLNSIAYYRLRWPDPDVPQDMPTWLYYEVDIVEDVVQRTVDVFADGRIERNSLALEERKGNICPSLVDGPFMETVQSEPHDLIPAVEFEELWRQGIDKPFWFPDGFPKSVQF